MPTGQERHEEAARLGFAIALIPEANAPKQPVTGLKIIAARHLSDAISAIRDL